MWEKPLADDNKLICLTFDDGPNDLSTKAVLSVLEKYHLTATFFLIGENIQRQPKIAELIAKKGFNIGNHSYSHDSFLFLKDTNTIKEDIIKTSQLIKSITGFSPKLFRAPNGLVNEKLQLVSKELDMSLVGVNIFVNDPMKFDESTVYLDLLKEITPNSSIMVLHDGFGTVSNMNRLFIATALEKTIRKLKKEGYTFGKLDDKGKCINI